MWQKVSLCVVNRFPFFKRWVRGVKGFLFGFFVKLQLKSNRFHTDFSEKYWRQKIPSKLMQSFQILLFPL